MKPLLESRQLHAFSALARRGSFTLAAKDLHLTQSAVSHALKALEKDLGCRLVDRVGKRVQLTEAGREFLRHTENILREMLAARTEMETVSRWNHRQLRLAAGATACEHFLPPVLRAFQESFPDCSIKIETGGQRRQLELLRAAQVDLAVVFEPAAAAADDLVFTSFFEDELCLIVSPRHRGAGRPSAPREEIESEPLFVPNKTGYTFRALNDYFREEKVVLSNFTELASVEAMKELVKLRLGSAVLPPWLVREELKNGGLVALPLGPRALRRRWSVAHWKGRRLASAEEAFIRLCETMAGGIEQPAPRAVA